VDWTDVRCEINGCERRVCSYAFKTEGVWTPQPEKWPPESSKAKHSVGVGERTVERPPIFLLGFL
jgi:hypothetical protein